MKIQQKIPMRPELLEQFRDTQWDRRESLADTLRGAVDDLAAGKTNTELADPGWSPSSGVNFMVEEDMWEKARSMASAAGLSMTAAVRIRLAEIIEAGK